MFFPHHVGATTHSKSRQLLFNECLPTLYVNFTAHFDFAMSKVTTGNCESMKTFELFLSLHRRWRQKGRVDGRSQVFSFTLLHVKNFEPARVYDGNKTPRSPLGLRFRVVILTRAWCNRGDH